MSLFRKKSTPNPPPDALDRAVEAALSQSTACSAPKSIVCEKCGIDRQKKYIDTGLFGSISDTYQECPCGNPDAYHKDWLEGVRSIPEAEYKGTCIVCGELSPGHHTCQACVDHDEYLANQEFSNPDRSPDISLSWVSNYNCGREWWAGNASQRRDFLGRLIEARNTLAFYNYLFNSYSGSWHYPLETLRQRNAQIRKVAKIRRALPVPALRGNDTEV